MQKASCKKAVQRELASAPPRGGTWAPLTRHRRGEVNQRLKEGQERLEASGWAAFGSKCLRRVTPNPPHRTPLASLNGTYLCWGRLKTGGFRVHCEPIAKTRW
jgi:hypothetical protein